MEKRYQVFVSSTYSDLIEERNEVMQALLELECMPAGMELFPAANDTQWNWIKKVIDESDYYMVIIAGRYGSISRETGQSYTEMEYRYAIDNNKPVIGFLHEDPSKLPNKLTEQSPSNRKKLESFRELVKKRLCKFYYSPADLGAKVSRSITQLKKQYPGIGWVRADILTHLTSSDEVLRLKKENEELKEKIYSLGIQEPKEIEELASGNELVEIDFSFIRKAKNPISKRWAKIDESIDTIDVSWDDIFSILGADIIESNKWITPTHSLIKIIMGWSTHLLEEKYPGDKFEEFKIFNGSYRTIMTQFRALKLIDINKEGKYELTPYGHKYLVKLLAVKKGKSRPG
jgi:hypothetical protein